MTLIASHAGTPSLRQTTIRGIPDEIEKMVRKEAKRKGMSFDKAFISLLERLTGIGATAEKKKIPYHDLDHLSGAWTKEDAAEFNKALGPQREIDEGLWKKWANA